MRQGAHAEEDLVGRGEEVAHDAEAAVASLPVVEDFQVLEDRVGQFDTRLPASLVEEFDLHPRPERFDHRVVVADAAEEEPP